MKRTVPLLITAIAGLLLIGQFFIPPMQMLGELAAIFFDILAAVAFILGGGNLLKVHLKKISDRTAGWAYSAITIVTFLVTLYVGLTKWGAPPEVNQEYYGETFATLPLGSFELVTTVPGVIPEKQGGGHLPNSVRSQLDLGDLKTSSISFRGWMQKNQKDDLIGYKDDLQWQCNIEALFKQAQPPKKLKGKVKYYADQNALSFKGRMTRSEQKQLLGLMGNGQWKAAVNTLHENSQRRSEITVDQIPAGLDEKKIKQVNKNIAYDAATKTLSIVGPMSKGTRDALARGFPPAKPLSADGRKRMLKQLTDLGKLNDAQIIAFGRVLDSGWTVQQFRTALDQAGATRQIDKSACEKLKEMNAGVGDIKLKKPDFEPLHLNDMQVAVLSDYVESDWSANELIKRLSEAGPFYGKPKPEKADDAKPDVSDKSDTTKTDGAKTDSEKKDDKKKDDKKKKESDKQANAINEFLKKSPTAARRKRDIWQAMLKAGPLTDEQQDFLLADYRRQVQWRSDVGRLFVAAHVVKNPWSGEYQADGGAFWWLYEYALKPLTATMFAMLAFYVASAAFRAFRAKNFEATLLLGTAFLILLGRTAAGVYLTAWLPDELSFLRIEELSVTVMKVFNTAGNRAIMIGIALGIVSTSLKVLLGIDRSYLGSSED